jgi:hypothetical protein
MNPFDQQQSTLIGHQQLVIYGLVITIDHPLGLGTGVTNLAGERLGATSVGTEVDLTNAFVSLGLPGGLIYSALLITTLWRAARLGLSMRDTATLATVGVLIVTLGQWLNGGFYALAPLVWFLVGWTNRQWVAQRAAGVEAHQRSPAAQVSVGKLRSLAAGEAS